MISVAVWKAVDEQVAFRGGAISALDAGIVVFWLATTVSVDYDVCGGVSAACSAECCKGGERWYVKVQKLFKVEIITKSNTCTYQVLAMLN